MKHSVDHESLLLSMVFLNDGSLQLPQQVRVILPRHCVPPFEKVNEQDPIHMLEDKYHVFAQQPDDPNLLWPQITQMLLLL